MEIPALIDYLKKHRDEYVDEIPPVIMCGVRHDEYADRPQYKAQTNWFQGVIGVLENARTSGQIPDTNLGERVDAFVKTIDSEEFKQRHTGRGDIDAANAIITDVIEHLSLSLANTKSSS